MSVEQSKPPGAGDGLSLPANPSPAHMLPDGPPPAPILARDKGTGRFLKGNPGGPGNPKLKAQNQRRSVFDGVLDEHCSREDQVEIVKKAVIDAKAGDRHARRDLWDRLYGKVPQEIDADVNVGAQQSQDGAHDLVRELIRQGLGGELPSAADDETEGGGESAPASPS